MSLTFQNEKYADLESELRPLIEAHWKEMPFDPQLPISLAPGYYQALEDAGRLAITTARDGGRLVGYYVNFIGKHPHYDVLMASQDVYFLLPEYRKGFNGVRLFRAMEQQMRELGVQYLLATARLDRRGADPLFDRLGWRRARVVYDKRLRGTCGIH